MSDNFIDAKQMHEFISKHGHAAALSTFAGMFGASMVRPAVLGGMTDTEIEVTCLGLLKDAVDTLHQLAEGRLTVEHEERGITVVTVVGGVLGGPHGEG